MAITNSVVYKLPAQGESIAGSLTCVKGEFTVQYTYTDAGAFVSAAITKSHLVTDGSNSRNNNTFNEVSGNSFDALGTNDKGYDTLFFGQGAYGDHIGASVSFNPANGQLDVKFQELQRNTDGFLNAGDAADYNQLNFKFTDSAAKSSTDADRFDSSRTVTIDEIAISYDKSGQDPTTFRDTGGTDDTFTAACYTKGTLIMTATGEVAVEDLSVGDQVMTVSGTLEPVIWLGNSTINCERQLNKDKAYPVRIVKDAFGVNLPKRDLFLSPDHSVYIDGVMIPAYCLINGSTITQEMTETLVTYYHVELPAHNAILAEGLPAESYLETSEANRHFFKDATTSTSSTTSNVTNMDTQYPACPEDTPAWKHIWDTQGFAKLTQDGPILEAVQAKLAERAELLMSKQALAA